MARDGLVASDPEEISTILPNVKNSRILISLYSRVPEHVTNPQSGRISDVCGKWIPGLRFWGAYGN